MMRLIGGNDNYDNDDEKEDELSVDDDMVARSQREQILIHDLMQTDDGKHIMLENIAKHGFAELCRRFNRELSVSQIKLIKMDIARIWKILF